MNKFYSSSTALIISGLFLFSCQQQDQKPQKWEGKKIANPIVYEVLIKNPHPEDEWASQCLANTESKQFVLDVIQSAEAGQLDAFDYYTNKRLSKKEIHSRIRKEKLKDRIGKIQFEEDWYWDKAQLKLRKEVKKIMFGYEIYDQSGKLRGYKASFVVDLEHKTSK